MKSEVNPIVVGVILVVVLAAVGFYFYKNSGYTVTKAEASKGLDFKVPGIQQQ